MMSNPVDLRSEPRAVRAIKRPLPVQVVFAPVSGTCLTLEGPVAYEAGDAIVTGPGGERWPIRRNRFYETYEPSPPTRFGEGGLYIKRPLEVLAVQLDRSVTVGIGDGHDALQGHPGDWLVQYGPDDLGIVERHVFEQTYSVIAPLR